MANEPLFSIIIPSFNRAHLITETLDSVKAQTFENWECIVVDDGSSDNTKSIVSAYLNDDVRFKYYDRPSSNLAGGNGARNFGAEKSQGQWLIFLDSDDLLIQTALFDRMKHEYQYDMLISVTGTFKRKLGDSDVIWNKVSPNSNHVELINRYINMDMPWHTNGVTWKRDFFQKIGGWNEKLRAWQDWEIHCRSLFYNPVLQFTGELPDNYFRLSRHDSIGKTIRSSSYMNSVYDSFVSIDGFLANNKEIYDLVKSNYEKLLCKMLISFPVKKGFLFSPLKTLKRIPFFKGARRFLFIKFYIIELLAKSYKIKTFVLPKTYARYEEFIVLKSYYLKYRISDL